MLFYLPSSSTLLTFLVILMLAMKSAHEIKRREKEKKYILKNSI